MDKSSDLIFQESAVRAKANSFTFLYTFPWWALILVLVAAFMFVTILSDTFYAATFDQLRAGVALTLTVSFVSYAIALVIGLSIGLIRAYPPKPAATLRGHVTGALRVALYNLATLYVSIMRGLPILVVLLIVAFVVVPAVRDAINTTFGTDIRIRGTSPESAIIALALTYGAFLSETFRAGIQSVERGQIEAAKSLGMNTLQVMRHIVLPQAFRRILPPLGNDMIAMIKDSSLVAILGINDVTQIAKLRSSNTFKFMETYLVAALLYLTMTIIGSMIVRWMERRLQTAQR
ncbi:MAG: amino acid ABC transporter permease [Chloroflexota bacterium]|nr:amino acid ABC transporter permease [Chloroflexota bacterium]